MKYWLSFIVSNENELQVKYDDLDQQIISSIENDFIRWDIDSIFLIKITVF